MHVINNFFEIIKKYIEINRKYIYLRLLQQSDSLRCPGMNNRQQQILETLVMRDSMTVAELSGLLDVSTVTIRSDLNHLAERGHVIRTHGSARIAAERVRQEFTFSTRQRINAIRKQRIGELAATLIQPSDSILLDASTTAVAVAQAIRRRQAPLDVTVVTTGIWTALELLGSPHINVVLAGGHVRNTTGSIVGRIATEILEKFNFHKAFLGASGIDIDGGLTDTPLVEVELKEAAIERSKEVIAVVDASKFGQMGLACFAPVGRLSRIVTDNAAPPEIIQDFQSKGIDVLIANTDRQTAADTHLQNQKTTRD
jgi:DeoR/GlpR family transcriptional regulator of sugar metabolism